MTTNQSRDAEIICNALADEADGDIEWFPVEDARLPAINANSDQFFLLVCRRVCPPSWEVTDE